MFTKVRAAFSAAIMAANWLSSWGASSRGGSLLAGAWIAGLRFEGPVDSRV